MSDRPGSWIPAYRKLFDPDHPIGHGRGVCRRFAFLDLCQMATREPRSVGFGGEEVSLQRGELVVSARTLAERWGKGWSRSTVSRFLRFLVERDTLTRIRETSAGTVYRIAGVDLYWLDGPSGGTPDGGFVGQVGEGVGQQVGQDAGHLPGHPPDRPRAPGTRVSVDRPEAGGTPTGTHVGQQVGQEQEGREKREEEKKPPPAQPSGAAAAVAFLFREVGHEPPPLDRLEAIAANGAAKHPTLDLPHEIRQAAHYAVSQALDVKNPGGWLSAMLDRAAERRAAQSNGASPAAAPKQQNSAVSGDAASRSRGKYVCERCRETGGEGKVLPRYWEDGERLCFRHREEDKVAGSGTT